jgi:hypothetical protein
MIVSLLSARAFSAAAAAITNDAQPHQKILPNFITMSLLMTCLPEAAGPG